MKGVVICGGESTRMGTDKGMIPLHQKNWAQNIAHLFTRLHIPFAISINEKQGEMYLKIFNKSQIIIDDANLKVKGPLLGLLSAHLSFPDEDLFVIACDMIEMDLPPLQCLLELYFKRNDYDTYLFKTKNELQPLCSIYTCTCLNTILQQLNNGVIKKFGLQHLLQLFNNKIEIPPEDWLHYFNNYNSLIDLNSFNK